MLSKERDYLLPAGLPAEPPQCLQQWQIRLSGPVMLNALPLGKPRLGG
jgi:hypothetical protein